MAEKRLIRAALLGFSLPLCVAAVACSGDFRKPFQRFSPAVDTALGELDGGKIDAAKGRLDSYLSATACDGGTVVVPGAADAAPATFDLGLALFSIAESFGQPFGTYVPPRPADAGDAPTDPTAADRKAQVDCARSLLDQALAGTLPADLEARARYLRGNLAYLDGRWDDAVADYDRALAIVPGLLGDAGDGIGRDAAWNRALALRNKEEEDKQKDAGADAEPDAQPDAEPDAGPDSGDDAGPDGGDDAGKDAGDDAGDDAGKDAGDDAGQDGGDAGQDGGEDGGKDGGKDGGDGKDAGDDGGKDGGKDGKDGKDGGADAGNQDGGADPQPSPASTASQDERMLDQFEGAPTFQKEEAKQRQGRRVQGMPDK
jgi:hypothetical protein